MGTVERARPRANDAPATIDAIASLLDVKLAPITEGLRSVEKRVDTLEGDMQRTEATVSSLSISINTRVQLLEKQIHERKTSNDADATAVIGGLSALHSLAEAEKWVNDHLWEMAVSSHTRLRQRGLQRHSMCEVHISERQGCGH